MCQLRFHNMDYLLKTLSVQAFLGLLAGRFLMQHDVTRSCSASLRIVPVNIQHAT